MEALASEFRGATTEQARDGDDGPRRIFTTEADPADMEAGSAEAVPLRAPVPQWEKKSGFMGRNDEFEFAQ